MIAPELIPCYAGGRAYHPMYSPHSGGTRPRDCRHDQVITLSPQSRGTQHFTGPSRVEQSSLRGQELGWARFWEIISGQLDRHDYSETSHELYRSVLRGFYRRSHCAPASVTTDLIRDHLNGLVAEHYSWNWIGMNISVLRTVFDKLGGQALTSRFATPKRPQHLPEILSPGEVRKILAAATTTRDQLLLGLLYGCGLKVGEVCRLTWADVDTARETLRVRYARGSRERTLPIPPELLPVLKTGVERCPPEDYIFQGRTAGTPLSTRMVQLILRSAVKSTDILKTVTCITLRHSFAVHCLENGESVRALQEALGHKSIDTTLLYESCILPEGMTSPLDAIKQRASPPDDQPRGAKFFTGPQPRGAKLFTGPISIATLDLPFSSRVERSSLREDFYRLLKTHILGRFLCGRRATIRAG